MAMSDNKGNASNGQQQFNLKWNNHSMNMLQVFTEQFLSEALVDVTLSCEGYFIKAHKMVLSACSLYFKELFRVHNVPHPLIIINGMKYTDVKQVITFMYRGEIKVLESELDSLLSVADSLQVKGLCTVKTDKKEYSADPEQDTESVLNEPTEVIPSLPSPTSDQIVGIVRQPKRRKLTNVKPFSPSEASPQTISDDSSLSTLIKIEPPEIKDIDQEEGKIQSVITMDEPRTELEINSTKPKPIKKSKSGRPIRPKTYTLSESSSPKKRAPNYTCHGFVDPSSKAIKIPRPPNAFMVFANEWRKKLASENPKESNKEISIRLGIMWKSLSSDIKGNYYIAARRADEEHKRKYPGYYYSPKEARLRKNMKEKLTTSSRTKKNCDAMRFVKLVMTDTNETEVKKWHPEHLPDEKSNPAKVLLNMESDDDGCERPLLIDTNHESNSSSPQ